MLVANWVRVGVVNHVAAYAVQLRDGCEVAWLISSSSSSDDMAGVVLNLKKATYKNLY